MSGFDELEPYAVAVRDVAMQQVQDERGVRVEDYLAVLASATGEAAIVASRTFDIEDNDMTPGAAVFGDAINDVLTGDATNVASASATTVVGMLRDRLVPVVASLDDFGSLERLYRHVAESVGAAAWGDVAVTVPEGNRHRIHPIRVAFELRPHVRGACAAIGVAASAGRVGVPAGLGAQHLCALALGSAIEQTRDAIDVRVGLTLALEITFGMAKMVPMSMAAFQEGAESEA